MKIIDQSVFAYISFATNLRITVMCVVRIVFISNFSILVLNREGTRVVGMNRTRRLVIAFFDETFLVGLIKRFIIFIPVSARLSFSTNNIFSESCTEADFSLVWSVLQILAPFIG